VTSKHNKTITRCFFMVIHHDLHLTLYI
jgi:hypothetical protein